ncbi:zinc-binding dehydrogenase [Tepidanaerobacter syntrophicus]|uniref:zinc-binding dehydrogenase n=1 Tax=Tepidanaerobacter syntrophicus TaxID=224999 RepID=UPI003B592038
MGEKMKAAVMYGPNDIRYEEVDRPVCPEGGFVLKVKAVGLCGSDIRNLTTDSRKGNYPYIYGHEVVGEVCEVSEEAKNYYKVGQMIYVYPEAHCLKCENCRSGHHEQCTDLERYTERPGGFAQYIAYTKKRVERGATYTLPKGVDPVIATLAEPMSSTYACVDNINVTLGDTVAIIGAGPIGIFLSILSKMRGARKVILIDINQSRLDKASEFNIDYLINSMKINPVEEVLKLTNNIGAHKVISANPSTVAQQQAILMAKKTGTVVFFGGVPKGELTNLDTNVIHYNGLWIYGHYGANSIQVQQAFELAISKDFPGEKIITHVLPLRDINKAIELTKKGEALKVVLLPNED